MLLFLYPRPLHVYSPLEVLLKAFLVSALHDSLQLGNERVEMGIHACAYHVSHLCARDLQHPPLCPTIGFLPRRASCRGCSLARNTARTAVAIASVAHYLMIPGHGVAVV